MRLKAQASYPTLQIQDVHCAEAPKRAVWDMLRVPTINAALSAPVPAHELWLPEQEDTNGMVLEQVRM